MINDSYVQGSCFDSEGVLEYPTPPHTHAQTRTNKLSCSNLPFDIYEEIRQDF
jgi:hypothetical protein